MPILKLSSECNHGVRINCRMMVLSGHDIHAPRPQDWCGIINCIIHDNLTGAFSYLFFCSKHETSPECINFVSIRTRCMSIPARYLFFWDLSQIMPISGNNIKQILTIVFNSQLAHLLASFRTEPANQISSLINLSQRRKLPRCWLITPDLQFFNNNIQTLSLHMALYKILQPPCQFLHKLIPWYFIGGFCYENQAIVSIFRIRFYKFVFLDESRLHKLVCRWRRFLVKVWVVMFLWGFLGRRFVEGRRVVVWCMEFWGRLVVFKVGGV